MIIDLLQMIHQGALLSGIEGIPSTYDRDLHQENIVVVPLCDLPLMEVGS